MGSEISDYLKATDETVKAAYSGWPVFTRASQVRAAEESWSVEVGVAAVEMYADGYNNRAKLRCQALVRYVAKAPTHDSLPQALDIATSLGAFLNHATMAMEDPDAPGNRVAVGEIVRDVRVFTEAETVMRGGVRVATGGVQVILQWEDELTVTPDIVIAGYDVTSPNRPPAQPGIDPPILQEITSISLKMIADGDRVRIELLGENDQGGALDQIDGLIAIRALEVLDPPHQATPATNRAIAQKMDDVQKLFAPDVYERLENLVANNQSLAGFTTQVKADFNALDARFTVHLVKVDLLLPDATTIEGMFHPGQGTDAYGGELLYIPLDGLGTLAKDQAVTIEGQKYRVTSLAADGRCWLASVEATS